MRTLIIVNLVFAGLLVTCGWIFSLFTYGAFVNQIGLQIGFDCGCVAVLLLFCIPVMFAVNIYGVFKYWAKYKFVTLVPFLVLVIAIVGPFALNVEEMSIRRFKKYLPDYEAFVKIAEKKYKLGELGFMGSMPKGYEHLGYSACIYDDKSDSSNEPNTMFVQILVGTAGIFEHTLFLYSSNGEIAPGSETSQVWPHQRRINEHWFRVSD